MFELEIHGILFSSSSRVDNIKKLKGEKGNGKCI